MNRPVARRARGRRRARNLALPAAAALVLACVFGAGGMFWYVHVPPVYEADSSVLLLVPQDTSENPLAYFPTSVILTAQIVSSRVAAPAVQDEVVAKGGLRSYDIEVPHGGDQWVPIYSQPVITLSIRDTDETAVNRTDQLVSDQIRRQLVDMQDAAGVPVDSRISVQVLPHGAASVVHGRRSRAVAGIGVLAAWLGVLCVMALRRRSQLLRHSPGRRSDRTGTAPPGPDRYREEDLDRAQAPFQQPVG